VLEQEGLFVGVELPTEGHRPALDVHDRLDEVSELLGGHAPQLVKRDGRGHDPQRHREHAPQEY
jgi:hypothetical protein